MFKSSQPPSNQNAFEVHLDGMPVEIPKERRSLTAIRSFLETLAMDRQRILCAFTVDGEPATSSGTNRDRFSFSRVEGETVDLAEMPTQLLDTALQQTADARERLETAVTLVLINDAPSSRELWWNLAAKLKEPLLTLSLLPETMCGAANGGASPMQLRKWQLQQLGTIIKDVDEACRSDDMTVLSNAMENRALPWLEGLHELISLWRQTALAGARLKCQNA